MPDISVLIEIKAADNLDARVARHYHARMDRRRPAIQRYEVNHHSAFYHLF
jgi:Spy/CpxP family protein refolding chaperone